MPVAVVDDHGGVGEGIRGMPESEPDTDTDAVAVASAPRNALALAPARRALPEVMVLDYRLADPDGPSLNLAAPTWLE